MICVFKLLNQSNLKLIKNNNQTRECGLIAQHLLEKLDDNMPNLVQEIPDETLRNLYGIDYSRLTTVLWATCRDLIKRIEILESKYFLKKTIYFFNQSLIFDQI